MSKPIVEPPFQPDSRAAMLHVLGGFNLRSADGHPVELKARKSRQLLAYLAVPSGQVRSREQLAALLWSDRQEEQARGSLRTALSGIRRAIGDDCLIIEHDTVRLRQGFLDTDYDHLKHMHENPSPISTLHDFYSGEFLAGQEHDSDLYMEWVHWLRNECAELAISILENSAAGFAKAGDNKLAIDLMRESLSLEPLKEQTHRTIMQLYATNGERAMALAQFRTCKELLLHELDAQPDPETQALADQIAIKNASASQILHDESTSTIETIAKLVELETPKPKQDEAPSIAVLPFVNMSGDAEQNYFADGMTEDIITDLSDIDGLSVAAKSSSGMYRGAAVSAVQISKEIGVRYILEGSIRKAGDSVRISAHLTDAYSNRQTWAERYDRRLENIFELQSEISRAIVNALEMNLTKTEVPITDKRTTANVEAYQYYQRGQVAVRVGERKAITHSFELFSQAIKLDPEYALAYSGKAQSAIRLVLHYDVERAMLVDALDDCNTALRLQPDLAEAWSARGYVYTLLKKFEKAREDIEKALSISPDLAVAHYHMGQYHMNTTGGIDAAYQSYKKAFELENGLSYGMMLVACLHGLDRLEELKSVSQKILKIAQRRVSLNPHDFMAIHMAAFAFYDLGEVEKAKYWAELASSLYTDDGAAAYNLACMHSLMGSIEEALEMLEETLKIGCNELKVRYMNYTDPDLDLVRKDPRFDALLVKYGYNLQKRKPRTISPKS